MDRLTYIYLLICGCIACINGRGQDSFPSCAIDLLVQRGMTLKTVPHQPLKVRCPFRHCGESLNVTWCKLLDTNKCEELNYTENIERRQNEKLDQDHLISSLTFTRISIDDDGLYRCHLKGYNYKKISHIINISVSDLNQGVENYDINAVDLLPIKAEAKARVDVSWLPYFTICGSVALLVTTLTVLTLLRFNGWRRILTFNHMNGQEMSTHTIPYLPNGNTPSTLVPHDIYFPTAAERPLSQPPLTINGGRPAVANTADESHDAVYAVVQHRQSGIPAREQHAAAKHNKNAAYAVINVS